MKLSIVTTHYQEEWQTCKALFDSIAIQQAVPFDEIEVIIAQDGEYDLSKITDNLKDFPCNVKTIEQPHKGISACRNLGLSIAEGDYVCFNDIDDMYISNWGLHLVFAAMQETPDVIVNDFVEEGHLEDGTIKLFPHNDDVTFVHGKFYRRQYLIDNDLKFEEELTIHEDSYFNVLAITCAETKRQIQTPIYLWKWNGNSVVRKDKEAFVLKTYSNLMLTRTYIARELEKRGFISEYFDCVAKTVLDSYYDFNKEEYLDEKNKHHVNRAKHAFKKFYEEFEQTYKEVATNRKAELAFYAKANAYKNGLIMESFTIKDFINEIKNEVE